MNFAVALSAAQLAGIGLETLNQIGVDVVVGVVNRILDRFKVLSEVGQGNSAPNDDSGSRFGWDADLERFVAFPFDRLLTVIAGVDLTCGALVFARQGLHERLLHPVFEFAETIAVNCIFVVFRDAAKPSLEDSDDMGIRTVNQSGIVMRLSTTLKFPCVFVDATVGNTETDATTGAASFVATPIWTHTQLVVGLVGADSIAQEVCVLRPRVGDQRLFETHFEAQCRFQELANLFPYLDRFRFAPDEAQQEVIGITDVAQAAKVGVLRVFGGQLA